MPFRARLKKTFSRNSTSISTSGSDRSSESNVYGPGEKIPEPKYRRPVNKEHKQKLEAFSFAEAWRRRSIASLYSPMGSRMPSRKNSAQAQQGRRSRSFAQAREGDTDGMDGMEDHHISSRPRDNTHLLSSSTMDSANPGSAPVSSKPNVPFTSDQLVMAMKRSNLDTPS
ncbi:hypothetical protein EJ08DRAFT_181558 [Tothia fuscella]|uniref:Uncharacterized protein n=1 Tax=Tothia fuscella TaxID=1048955 RepID=A0A9P4TZN4_9PEZI|nr:hypothetical protein EJ08DRAFT_181558 [Tothia fuscella]